MFRHYSAILRELAVSTLRIYTSMSNAVVGRVQLKCDGTRCRTGGEVKGKLANAVGTSEHGVSSITTADAHTSAVSSRLN